MFFEKTHHIRLVTNENNDIVNSISWICREDELSVTVSNGIRGEFENFQLVYTLLDGHVEITWKNGRFLENF